MKKILGIIPARLSSTRLAQKMLADVHGKPLIYYAWRQAKQSKMLNDLIIATDSERIADAVRGFGGVVVMTSAEHQSGTDRVAEAAGMYSHDIVLNIQGDEPVISPSAIDAVAQLLLDDPEAVMGTVATPFRSDEDIAYPGSAKVVLDKNNYALYFSRFPIPYARNPFTHYLKQVAVYSFRREFLLKYASLPQGPLEMAEGLEHLRALENGYRIKVAVGNFDSLSVDYPEDLERVRKVLAHQQEAAAVD